MEMDPTKKRKLDGNGAVQTASDAVPGQLTVDDVRKIIELFTNDQLLEIVQNAAVRHAEVLEAVRSIADRDPAQRKLFVRGLGWDTTTEKLRAIFAAYGDIEEAVVILDKGTGKSKGYGFVTFKHVDGALLALKEPSKKIDGRMTVTQLASAGVQGQNTNSGVDVSMRKIYVANVPYDMPAERLLAHFLSYGEIEEGPLGFDKATGKSKGFALFVYKTAEAARASLVDPIKTIDGRQLNCKLAIEGKKGKPGVPGEAQGDGLGMHSRSTVSGSLGPGQYGGPGGSYGGFSGGLQGLPPGHLPLNSSLGGSQAPSSMGAGGGYGSGMGGQYGGSHYGGPASAGYGGMGGAGSSGGMGGAGGGLGGTGPAARGSSSYGLPPSSGGMPSSGYPDGAHYGFSSSAYASQHHQPTGTSPVPRVPPGGVYQGGPQFY